MNWVLYIYCTYSLFLNQLKALSNNSSREAQKDAKLPPCAACRTLTESFNQGMTRTERGKFEGGDAAWEEEKMKAYTKSEVRLVEIQEKLCTEVDRGQTQCHSNHEEHETLIEDWWFHHQDAHPTLYDWLCIEKLTVCCPAHHYGSKCLPCKGGVENPCGGNGRCKGAGTRRGNGNCECNAGYEGELCDKCSIGYFEAYKDETKTLCETCHKACDGPCSQAGPRYCTVCKEGWLMDENNGCIDVNECLAEQSPCKINHFCVNNEGNYTCVKCDKGCNGCSGDGPDMCIECAKEFELENDVCVDKSGRDREQHLAFARYVTYAGLTIATCIILQRHTLMAAFVGLSVAMYISFSEYYLSYFDGEANRGNSNAPFDLGSATDNIP